MSFLLKSEAQKRRVLRAVLWVIFGFYLLALAYGLFFMRIDFTGYAAQRAYYRANIDLMTNFTPLTTIRLYLRCLRYNYIGVRIPLANLVGNLLLFMPMGFFLPCLFAAMRRWWLFALLMLFALAAAEGLQFLLCCGSCDVDDVALNLCGALLVYFLLRIPGIQRLMRRLRLLPESGA